MEALAGAVAERSRRGLFRHAKICARAYSCNFDEETLPEAVRYAHLREVKVYVTMNTSSYSKTSLRQCGSNSRFLNEIGVDGVIVQDIAVFEEIVRCFPDMEAHCSTQMGIDDLGRHAAVERTLARSVELAREVEIEKGEGNSARGKIHWKSSCMARSCVSYSGNCLMSGLIGYRSWQRGRCVGSCRKPYEPLDKTSGKSGCQLPAVHQGSEYHRLH